MIVPLLLAVQAPATAVYADCLSGHINADARMVKPPADEAGRLAIFDDAARTCAAARAKVPKTQTALLDRIDASLKQVLANPQAAEAEFGTDPLERETP